jgi:hypothetical protein
MGPLPSMSPAKVDVPAFLREQKRAFLEAVKTGEAKEWILVTGNESAGLFCLAHEGTTNKLEQTSTA